MTFPIPDAAFAQHTIALGKTRSGKSSKLRLIVERLLAQQKPVSIIDPKGDWWGIKSSADGKSAGFPLVIFGGEHADVPINETSGGAVAEIVATGNRPCVIDLGGWMVGARTRFFIDFASTLFRLTRGHRWLVIDECHNFAPQGKVQDVDAGKMLHWSNRLASEGGGKGLTLISASQRPQKVHKDYVTSHETLIACRVIHKLDRDAIGDWIDGCADPAKGKEVIAALANMERRQAYVWSPEIKFGPALIDWPMFSTYDSFKPQTHGQTALKGWASVDLEDVKVRLAKTIEEVKANDPRALKAELVAKGREIDKLKLEIGILNNRPTETGWTTDMVAGAETAAREEGYAHGYREGSAANFDALWESVEKFQSMVHNLSDELRQKRTMVMVRLPEIPKPKPTAKPPQIRAPSPQKRQERAPVVHATNGDATLTNPQKTLLRSLAWWSAMGHETPTRPQVAAIAGWKPSGSNLKDRLSELSKAGLVEYPQTGVVSLTAAGRDQAPEPDLARTLDDSIRAILTGPQHKLYDELRRVNGAVERRMLAAAVGWEPDGSNLKDRLSELSRLEVVCYPQRGTVKLQDWVTA